MITLGQVISKSAKFLEKKGINSPRRQAEEVISISLCKPRLELYMYFDKPLDEQELVTIRTNLARRAKKEPLQYIEGSLSFYDTKLKVDSKALIPRQETEILVDLLAKKMSVSNLKGKKCLDLCTGSGAIAIALKNRFPELDVYASDFSQSALTLASENAKKNRTEITFKKGDLFEPFEGMSFDFIVSNPPYISEAEYEQLEPEVKDYEPKMALVAGAKGTEFYSRIAKDLRKYLKNQGHAYFELGFAQSENVKQIFEDEGFNKNFIERDYSGTKRFFFLELE